MHSFHQVDDTLRLLEDELGSAGQTCTERERNRMKRLLQQLDGVKTPYEMGQLVRTFAKVGRESLANR